MRYDRPVLWLGAGFTLAAIWRTLKRSRNSGKSLEGVATPHRRPAETEPGEEKRSPDKPRLVPPARVLSAFLVGAILLVASAKLYSNIVSPTQAPIVPGTAQLYVTNPAVATELDVAFPMASGKDGDSQVVINIAFLGNSRAKSVSWALVMYGDACLAEEGKCLRSADQAESTTLPPGAQVTIVKIAQTPFTANPKNTLAQIIYGTTYFLTPVGRAGASIIKGHIKATVVNSSGPDWNMTLPSYGRLAESPLFEFPSRPGALDLSIPGDWHQPTTFEVDIAVHSPGNDSNHHVDVASPPLADPQFLEWQSSESVRGVVQRTDLNAAAHQQILIFLLGAIVGAGAPLVLLIFQWPIEGAFDVIASRASRSSRGAQAKRARTGSHPGNKQKSQPGL